VDETSSTKSFSELVVKSKHHVAYCQERLREKKWTSFLSRDNGGQKREKRQQPNLAQLGLLPIGSAMDKNSSRLHDIIIIISPIRVSIRKEDKMHQTQLQTVEEPIQAGSSFMDLPGNLAWDL